MTMKKLLLPLGALAALLLVATGSGAQAPAGGPFTPKPGKRYTFALAFEKPPGGAADPASVEWEKVKELYKQFGADGWTDVDIEGEGNWPEGTHYTLHVTATYSGVPGRTFPELLPT